MRLVLTIAALALTVACNPDEMTDDENPEEVITTVTLTFTPGTGSDVVASFVDLQDGNPTVDPITLSDAEDYTLTVEFLNELEDPAEDITEEIMDEDDEHQVFFTGGAVSTLVTHAYDDQDGGGLPVGLDNTITTDAVGTDTLTVTLRHLPPEGGEAVKVAGMAETVAAEGFGAIGGDTDVSVDFDLTVQ